MVNGAPPADGSPIGPDVIFRAVFVIFYELSVAVVLAGTHVRRVSPAAAAEACVNWFILANIATNFLFNCSALIGAVAAPVAIGAVNIFDSCAALFGGVAEAAAAVAAGGI